MNERDIIFRERLIALVGELNAGKSKDLALRRALGAFAVRMAREAGARNWADLKERADGSTYDSALQLFQRQSEIAQQTGKTAEVKAFELLAVSLIARRQYQSDLVQGVELLDDFIGQCEQAARRTKIIPVARAQQ